MMTLALSVSQAGLPEPDAIVYGSVVVDGQPASAADTHLVIEVRHELNGPPLAATSMGTEPAAGNYYVLRLPLESGLPLVNPNAVVAGDGLHLLVLNDGEVVDQASFTIADRGQSQRIDLGAILPDADDDGLPDAWEIDHYGTLDYRPGSIGMNGRSLSDNFIAGTDPNDESSGLAVTISYDGEDLEVSFISQRAEGPGYEGRTRYYTVQSSPTLEAHWEDVPGYTRLAGENATVVHREAQPGQPAFYRVQVWLE